MHCHQLSGKFLSPKLHQRGCIPSQHRSPHRRSTPSLLQLYGSEGLVSQLASGYIVDVAQSMESPSKVVDVVPTSTEVGEGANCYCGARGTEPDSQQGFLTFLHYTDLMDCVASKVVEGSSLRKVHTWLSSQSNPCVAECYGIL